MFDSKDIQRLKEKKQRDEQVELHSKQQMQDRKDHAITYTFHALTQFCKHARAMDLQQRPRKYRERKYIVFGEYVDRVITDSWLVCGNGIRVAYPHRRPYSNIWINDDTPHDLLKEYAKDIAGYFKYDEARIKVEFEAALMGKPNWHYPGDD